MMVKVVGQRSNAKIRVLTSLLPCSKVRIKVKGRGQGHGLRSRVVSETTGEQVLITRVKVKFWCAAVDIRGSAVPSAAKSNKSHYQSKVFVCVSVIRGCIQIIAWIQSIGF